jgi:hypothetical protein
MKMSLHRRPSRRVALIGVVAVVWLAALFGGALPAWRRALSQHREVQQVEARFQELDRWSVAGVRLEHSLAGREAAVTPVWERLFPAERRCEALFLDLARVADESGVDRFELHELKGDEMATVSAVSESSTDAVAPTAAADSAAALTTYRVRAHFESDFAGVAGFLGGLGRLDRATVIHQLKIRPTKTGVETELELDVYVASSQDS